MHFCTGTMLTAARTVLELLCLLKPVPGWSYSHLTAQRDLITSMAGELCIFWIISSRTLKTGLGDAINIEQWKPLYSAPWTQTSENGHGPEHLPIKTYKSLPVWQTPQQFVKQTGFPALNCTAVCEPNNSSRQSYKKQCMNVPCSTHHS